MARVLVNIVNTVAEDVIPETSNATSASCCAHASDSQKHPWRSTIKKVAAGNDPASVKAICFDCCNHPPSNVQDSSAPRHPIAPAAPQAEPRGRCVTCRVEYPLTDKFFTIGDIRITRDQSRTCYKCRRESKLREVTESLAIQEGWEDAAPEEDGIFNEPPSEDDEAPITKYEDLAPEAQEEARAAGRQFERLVTARYLTTSRVVRERLRSASEHRSKSSSKTNLHEFNSISPHSNRRDPTYGLGDSILLVFKKKSMVMTMSMMMKALISHPRLYPGSNLPSHWPSIVPAVLAQGSFRLLLA